MFSRKGSGDGVFSLYSLLGFLCWIRDKVVCFEGYSSGIVFRLFSMAMIL